MRMSIIKDAIELVPLTEADPFVQRAILFIRNQDEVRRNMYTDHVITEDEHARWVERLRSDAATKFFAVICDGKVIGGVSLNAINRAHKRAEWAFYLDGSLQGRGIGSALEFRFLDMAFGEEALEKLNCEVLAFNQPVIKLHTKFGFKQEGIRRDHIIRDGAKHDTVLLGITKNEWADRRHDLTTGAFK